MRKFEILEIRESPGGPGPERAYQISYRAIVKKQWVEKDLWIIARNKSEAKKQAEDRFGDKISL